MEEAKTYLFSVIISAFLCSMLRSFGKNFKADKTINFICGIIMTISVLYPVVNWRGLDTEVFFPSAAEKAEQVAALGREYANNARADIIKLKTEAYILDKATELDADISVCVTISESDEAIPVSVVISGNVSVYAKKRLEMILEENLGIPKENQQWNG